MEPRGDHPGHGGHGDGADQDGARREIRAEVNDGQQRHAADGGADPIDADVDDGLGRALLRGRQRRVEELVGGSVQRVPHDRLPAAQQHDGRKMRHHQRDDGAQGDRDGLRLHGPGKAAPLEEPSREPRLREEREDAHDHVEEREEAEERRSLAVFAGRMRAEQPVEQRVDDRAGQHEQGEVAEVRRLAHDLPATAGERLLRLAEGAGPDLAVACAPDGAERAPQAEGVDAREERQHHRHGEVSGGAPDDDAAHDAADGPAARDAAHDLLGAVRVEPFVHQRPERADHRRAVECSMHVNGDGGGALGVEAEPPLEQEEGGAAAEHHRHDAGRAVSTEGA